MGTFSSLGPPQAYICPTPAVLVNVFGTRLPPLLAGSFHQGAPFLNPHSTYHSALISA